MRFEDACLEQAVDLMERALALLDGAGHGATSFACHLSLAIDVAHGEPPTALGPWPGPHAGPDRLM